jgi:ribosomal protein S18 acetylase RimI-like enzyme
MYEPDERKTTVNEMAEHIENISRSGSLMLIAESDNKIVGFLTAERGFAQRIKHSAYIVVGVLKDYSGFGIGNGLFEGLMKWSAENKITRLELTVMCHNERALGLYKKMGFTIEGVKHNSLIIDSKYVDEYYMAKLDL